MSAPKGIKTGGPLLVGSKITIDRILAKSNPQQRSATKIICTLGPACWDVDQLEAMIDAGMTVARFNFSHGDHAGHQACLERLKIAAANKKKMIAVMLDTKGPEIRTGFFANDAKEISVVKGETIVLTSDYSYMGDNKKLACSYQSLAKSVNPGQKILMADGSVVLTVLSTNLKAKEVSCRIENSASFGERKNMNLPGVNVDLPTLTDKDIDDIQLWGVKNQVDFISVSFVHKASDVLKIREVLGEAGKGIKIFCKIESQEGMENYDEILEVTDGIMCARGDLGMDIPPEKVFLAQKMMIRKANIAGKPVITATQMLESMITNPRPTRAECSDVANAVLDGTDCVMLSGETANGEYPVKAVTIMSKTCIEAEGAQDTDLLFKAVGASTLLKHGKLSTSESVASSAVKTCIDLYAKAIIVVSETGTTAREVAKFRPGRPIYAITANAQVARQCHGVLRGVDAIYIDNMSKVHATIEECINKLKADGICKSGDAIAIVAGTIHHSGATNLMRVQYA